MALKWNPATGRYEQQGGTPPPTTEPTKRTSNSRSRQREGQRRRTSPTTTVPNPFTTVPAGTNMDTVDTGNDAPNTGGAATAAQADAAMNPTTTTTTVPAKKKSPKKTTPAAPVDNTKLFEDFITQDTAMPNTGLTTQQIISNISGLGGGGGTAKVSAAAKRKAAVATSNRYKKLAQDLMNQYTAGINANYAAQNTAATSAIDEATKQYLAAIQQPTAYQNMPVANAGVPTQGLQDVLASYGVQGNQASGLQQQQNANMQFIADLARQSGNQMGAANTDYMTALKNAGLGTQLNAKTGLAQNLAANQQASMADAEAVRRQLLLKAINALAGY